jgi:U32 family peptidase
MDQIPGLKMLGCKEALICTELRSQEGGLKEELLPDLLQSLHGEGIEGKLLFDRRVQEKDWAKVLPFLENIPVPLRVMDLGLARELDRRGLSFELDLQIGHLNYRSVEVWLEKLRGVKRICFNPQIPRRQLLPFLETLSVESECLGFGPIAMYHTPRPLLEWSGSGKSTHIKSEEMGSGSFVMKESLWGSTLYYNKTLSLLPHLSELEDAGLSCFRIDLRWLVQEELELVKKGVQERVDIRDEFPQPLLHGFYGENKSDSLFAKIGGRRSDMDRVVLGEVLDGRGRDLLVRSLGEGWDAGISVFCEDGKGRSHSFVFEGGEDLDGKALEQPGRGKLFKLKASRKFPVGTFLYGQKSPEG